jgi:hypothetical protein
MPYTKANPQVEYRERQARRAEHSVSLAIAYPQLRSLTLALSITRWASGGKSIYD